MIGWLELWIIGSIMFIFSILPPALHYQRMKLISREYSQIRNSGFTPNLTILLPVKNEELFIERKILEATSMTYAQGSVEFLIVDSGSTDNTLEIAERKLMELVGPNNWRVITVDRPGKTLAVKQAMESVKTEFFVMMDADSKCTKDSLEKLIGWFESPEIGAVCAHQYVSESENGVAYRSRFNTIRKGESALFSTPIFEGSLCAFRIDALKSGKLDPEINADDSQLAMIAIGNGFKALMDPELSFEDLGSQTSRERKVRRAQGLTRALLKNRRISKINRSMRQILNNAIYFHLLMPWMMFFSVLIFSIASVTGIVTSSEGNLINLVTVTFLFSLYFATFTSFGRAFFNGISILLESHLRLISGQRLQVWDTSRKKCE